MKKISTYIALALLLLLPQSMTYAQTLTPANAFARQILISRYFAGGPYAGAQLMSHLQQIFVLDSLFAASSNGLLTAGPVTIENAIVIYELFLAGTYQ